MNAPTLVIGTANPAKLEQIIQALTPLSLSLRGLEGEERGITVEETGSSLEENARIKALAYATLIKTSVLSMDNGLYLEGLPPELQPGINVRRFPGSTGRPSDQEALTYYCNLIASIGTQVKGHWEFSVALATPTGVTTTTISSPRIFVSVPSPVVLEGYPLESIQINPETGAYLSEMNELERAQFWQEKIGQELCQFVTQSLERPTR